MVLKIGEPLIIAPFLQYEREQYHLCGTYMYTLIVRSLNDFVHEGYDDFFAEIVFHRKDCHDHCPPPFKSGSLPDK